MFLTAPQVHQLGEVAALLAGAAATRSVQEQIAEPMLRLLDADFFVSCVWDAKRSRFGTLVALNMDPCHARAWDEHFQFVDPVTPRMRAVGRAAPVNDVIPQRELVRTEFFNDFLAPGGLHWGINLYVHDGADCIGDMRIWRTRRRGSFTDDDVQLLQMLAPAYAKALGSRAPLAAHPGLQLKRAFGLSERESAVALRVAGGCSDKEVARQLGIGVTTVRYHLRHACEKAGVVGRGRLASAIHGSLAASAR